MCYIIHMDYEFNNWKAFYEMIEFVEIRHKTNSPILEMKVPVHRVYRGWASMAHAYNDIKVFEPEDLSTMSIYGCIKFTVNKDECNAL